MGQPGDDGFLEIFFSQFLESLSQPAQPLRSFLWVRASLDADQQSREVVLAGELVVRQIEIVVARETTHGVHSFEFDESSAEHSRDGVRCRERWGISSAGPELSFFLIGGFLQSTRRYKNIT